MAQKKVTLVADFDATGIRRGTRQAESELSGFRGRVKKGSAAMTGAIAGGVGGAVAAITGSLIPALQGAVEEAANEEEAVTKLTTTLQNVTGMTADAAQAQSDLIASWQYGSTFADDDLRPAYARLVTATEDVAKAQDLLRLAMDVAAGTGKPLSAVVEALAKAQNGSYLALRKLDPAIDVNAAKSGGLAAVTDDLRKKFGGADEAASKTAKGSLQDLGDAVGDIQSELGTALLPTLKKFTDWARSPDGQDALRQMGAAFESLGAGLAVVADKMTSLANAWNSLPEELRRGLMGPVLGDWFGWQSRSAGTTFGGGTTFDAGDPAAASFAASPTRRLAAGGGGIVVNVSGALDPEGVARQVDAILSAHARRVGSVRRGRAW